MKNNADDLNNLSLVDIAFLIIECFALICVILLIQKKDETVKKNADVVAEFIISVDWTQTPVVPNKDDIDVYLEDPVGNICWYKKQTAGLLSLDHDDTGSYSDTIMVDGKKVEVPYDKEFVTIRGIIPGEYTLNVHMFTKRAPGPTKVKVGIDKVNPKVKTVFIKELELTNMWEEQTVARFTLDAEGNISNITSLAKNLAAEQPHNISPPQAIPPEGEGP